MYFKFDIERQSGKDMYVTLFDLSTDGSIQILYPPSGAADQLGGAKVRTQQVFMTTGPSGMETFKIIATSDQTDFAFLQRTRCHATLVRLNGKSNSSTQVRCNEGRGVDDWGTSQMILRSAGRRSPRIRVES